MTANNPITDLLGAPLTPDWTVEDLAEQVLGAIAAQTPEETLEFVLDEEASTNRQSRRLLRPLLACLATKAAAEAGTPANLYGGHFSFKRVGPKEPVWILGQFENRPGCVRVSLRRSNSAQGHNAGTRFVNEIVLNSSPAVLPKHGQGDISKGDAVRIEGGNAQEQRAPLDTGSFSKRVIREDRKRYWWNLVIR